MVRYCAFWPSLTSRKSANKSGCIAAECFLVPSYGATICSVGLGGALPAALAATILFCNVFIYHLVRLVIYSMHCQAAADVHGRASHVARTLGSEEDDDIGHFF